LACTSKHMNYELNNNSLWNYIYHRETRQLLEHIERKMQSRVFKRGMRLWIPLILLKDRIKSNLNNLLYRRPLNWKKLYKSENNGYEAICRNYHHLWSVRIYNMDNIKSLTTRIVTHKWHNNSQTLHRIQKIRQSVEFRNFFAIEKLFPTIYYPENKITLILKTFPLVFSSKVENNSLGYFFLLFSVSKSFISLLQIHNTQDT
jgi:hypothetical protein